MADLEDYWLTFRIENIAVGGRSPNQRRDDLYNVVDGISNSWWLEPTSFILFDSVLEFSVIAAKCKAVISAQYDLVLIRKLNTKDARVIGKVESMEMLKAFMPYLSKA